MRPLILQGHERPITQVKYNREGDLLFTIAKEKEPNVWFTVNGERLGTYDGHKGAVWCLDVDWQTRFLITGAADDSLNIWDVETGKLLNSIKTLTSVRSCQFSYGGNSILLTTDNIKNQKCEMMLFDVRDNKQIAESNPLWRVDCPMDSKITNCLWGPVDSCIYTGHDNGMLCKFNMQTMSFEQKMKVHSATITDMQASRDNTMFITSSKDQTATLFNAYDMEIVKKYSSDRPLNSAAISPNKDHVLLGGGQEAAEVTKTAASKGKFEALFYHSIFEMEITSVKGHFGPINSVAFNPTGQGYASGGEEGLVRMYQFDKDYYDFDIEY